MAITITGANGDVVSIKSPTGKYQELINDTANTINASIANGTSEVFDLVPGAENPNYTADTSPVGIVQEAGSYNVPNAYRYIVVADDGEGTDSGAVTLNSNGFLSGLVTVLSGRTSGLTYNASNESGVINTTAGNLVFNGSGKTGGWTIYADTGNASISSTNGNNIIATGRNGKSTVALGSGNNSLNSQGQDTITGGDGGYNSVTLSGSKASVSLRDNTVVTDVGVGNAIIVGKNSTVAAGTNGTTTFNNGGNQNSFIGGVNETVSAINGSEVKYVFGTNNTYSSDATSTFLNPSGKISVTSSAQAALFGAKGSNYTLNATGSDSGLFVADAGNETLNAAGSTAAIAIYANTVAGGNTNFVATGGSGNDLLAAGTGNSTFTGGAGDNLFAFTKSSSDNGNTVITDFGSSSGNKIGIYGYGVDSGNLQQLLNNSTSDANNDAVLKLEGHTITLEGVSVSSLNTNMFSVPNATAQTV